MIKDAHDLFLTKYRNLFVDIKKNVKSLEKDRIYVNVETQKSF